MMRPHLRWLMPACLALLAPGAAFCGQPAIVITSPPVSLAWDQPAVVFAAPAATTRIVVTVNPPWVVHAPYHPGHRRWHGHGPAHRYVHPHRHGHRHAYAPDHHGYGADHRGYGPDRHVHGPDRLGWR